MDRGFPRHRSGAAEDVSICVQNHFQRARVSFPAAVKVTRTERSRNSSPRHPSGNAECCHTRIQEERRRKTNNMRFLTHGFCHSVDRRIVE
jgi:hypothetical protein